jgi:hypothetical protein
MLEALLKKIKTREEKIIEYVIKKIDSGEKKKKKKRRDKVQEKPVQEKQLKVSTDVQVRAIVQSVKQNYIFYLAVLISLFAFTKCHYKQSNFILCVFSFGFITFYGYFIHLISHYMGTKVSDLYKTYDNIFTRNKYLNWIAIKTIEFGEFHAKTHHDTEINKSKKNIALEFINNVVSQGGLLIIIKYFLKFVDNRVILLWAFFYASVHNINYNMVSPLVHRQHHMNDKTNYGIDIWDIIVGSKYDWNTIETHNHTAINLLVISTVIVFCSNKFKI